MDLTKNFKAQAENLRFALEQMNLTVSAAQATELVAAQYSLDTWAKLRAGLKQVPQPTLGAGQSERLYETIEIDVGDGNGVQWCSIEHELYDSELLSRVHDEAALRAHWLQYQDVYQSTDPKEEVILGFYSARNREHTMKASEFIGIQYEGDGYWFLKDGRRIRFSRDEIYRPESSMPFEVPKLLKSTKGCYLVPFKCVLNRELIEGNLIVPPGRDGAALSSICNTHVIALLNKGGLDVESLKAALVTFARGVGAEAVFG